MEILILGVCIYIVIRITSFCGKCRKDKDVLKFIFVCSCRQIDNYQNIYTREDSISHVYRKHAPNNWRRIVSIS